METNVQSINQNAQGVKQTSHTHSPNLTILAELETKLVKYVPNPANPLGNFLPVLNPELKSQSLEWSKSKLHQITAPIGQQAFSKIFEPYLNTMPRGAIEGTISGYVQFMSGRFSSCPICCIVPAIEAYIADGGKFWPPLSEMNDKIKRQVEKLETMKRLVGTGHKETEPQKRARQHDTSHLGPEFDENGQPNWMLTSSGTTIQISDDIKDRAKRTPRKETPC